MTTVILGNTMSINNSITIVLVAGGFFSQADSYSKSTSDYFRSNNIALNVLHHQKGIVAYIYVLPIINCSE